MALTYVRPAHAFVAARRSSRVTVPTAAVRQVTPTIRRVRFTPLVAPFATFPPSEEESEDENAKAAHLPQSFQHTFSRSSLEPGTTNLNFPPSHTFPNTEPVGGDPVQHQTPVQVATWLHNALNDSQELLGELKATIWDKATDQERRPQ